MIADIELLVEPGPGRARIPAEFRELIVEAERQTRIGGRPGTDADTDVDGSR